jgi:hypothetical protein
MIQIFEADALRFDDVVKTTLARRGTLFRAGD